MILVDGYRDGMLWRTTMISGGGGCKAFGRRVRRAPASCARERAHGRAEEMCDGGDKCMRRNATLNATKWRTLMRLSVGREHIYMRY